MSLDMQGITRRHDHRQVLRGATMSLGPGEAAILTGANGAGKSTLLRIAATQARPDAGTLTVAGIDARADPAAARRHIGYLPHDPPLYGDLTPQEHIRFWARLHGTDPESPILHEAGLRGDARDAPCRTLSRGQRQRVALALALLHRPRLLLLDEPTTGLDPAGVAWLAGRLREARADGAAVLAALHAGAGQPALDGTGPDALHVHLQGGVLHAESGREAQATHADPTAGLAQHTEAQHA